MYIAFLTSLLLTPIQTAAPAPQMVSLTLTTSLEATLARALPKEGRALAAELARLLRWQGDVNRNVHRGDRLALLYEDVAGAPELVAAQFMGSQMQLRAYRHQGPDNIPRYYTAEGVRVEPEMLNTPVPAYVQITETVQHGRGKRRHRGIDLKAPEGTPIRLPFAGRVLRVNWAQRFNGRCIELALDNGQIARFLHMAYVDKAVRVGARLPVGTALGAVGNTGRSGGAHLHYEVLLRGQPREPLDVHGRRQVRLAALAMPEFIAARDQLDRALMAGVLPIPAPVSAQACSPVAADPTQALGCLPTAAAEP